MVLAFREARGDDIPAIDAVVQAAFRGAASRDGWTTEADLLDGQRTDPDALRAMIDSARGAVLLAEDGTDLVACCQVENRVPDTAYIGMVAVRPRLQRGGVGRALLAEAERRALESGARVARMTVIRQRTELIAWYERRGYRSTGETAPFPYGDERYGLPKRDDLEFVVLEKSLT